MSTPATHDLSSEALPRLIMGMTFKEYLDDPMPRPSLTSSLVRSLLETAPRAIWERTKRLNPHAEDQHKTTFDIGSAAHGEFVGEGEPIVVVPFDSYRKNDAKEMRDDAYAERLIPVLEHDMERVQAMADEARDYFGNHQDTGPILAHEALVREGSVFWQEGPALCRARPDLFLPPSSASLDPTIIHYKTTGTTINAQTLPRFAANQKWDLIAAHYHESVLALGGSAPRQYFAIQETEPPYLCMVAELHELFLQTAQMRRDRALYIWRRCLAANNWPGHIDRTVLLSIPVWHENAAIEAKDIEQAHRDDGADLLDMARRWQAPLTRTKEQEVS